MSIKKPLDYKNFSQKYNLDSTNFLTLTSPKVLKNLKESEAPTAVLYMFNDEKACPFADTCRDVCLIQSGRAIFSEKIMECRKRRHNAFLSDYSLFMRFCIAEVIRHYSKHRAYDDIGFRFNGTSDWNILRMPITLKQVDTDYLLRAFNVYIEPIRYGSIIEALMHSFDVLLNQSVGIKLKMYDYTKRPITSDDLQLAKKLNYHLTLSHGSKADLFSVAIELGLNYACSFKLAHNEPLPKTFTYKGITLEVLDGDLTDWRVSDPSDKTRIIGLKHKRTKNQDIKAVEKFCINTCS